MPDIQKRIHPRAANLTINLAAYLAACARHGLPSSEAQADAFGVDPITVYRVRTDRMAPGPRFLAGLMRAMPDVTLKELLVTVDYVPRLDRPVARELTDISA